MPSRYRQSDPYSSIRLPQPDSTSVLDKAMGIYGIGEEKRRYKESTRRYEEERAYRSGRDVETDKYRQAQLDAQNLAYKMNVDKMERANEDLLRNRFNEEYAFGTASALSVNPSPLVFNAEGQLDTNSLVATKYGPGNYNQRMEDYRKQAEIKGVKNPSYAFFNEHFKTSSQNEANQVLNQMLNRKTTKGLSEKDFNISLRGAENTLVGPKYIEMLMTQASPDVAERFAAGTGFDPNYETGFESFMPFSGPRESLTSRLPAGESIAGTATKGLVGGGIALETAGRVSDWFNKEAIAKGLTYGEGITKQQDILKQVQAVIDNKKIRVKKGPAKGRLLPQWRKSVPKELKKLIGKKKFAAIQGSAGLDAELKAIEKEIKKLTKKQSKYPKAARYKPSAMIKGGKVPKVVRAGGNVIKGGLPYAAPLVGGWVGQKIAGDEGQLGGETLGFGAFLMKRAPRAAARVAKMAALRHGAATSAGTLGGPWGVAGSNALMLLVDVGFTVMEARKLYKDFQNYQKTGKINP